MILTSLCFPRLRYVSLALALLIPSLAKAAEERPPNIVFILVDDLGWSDLGAYGSAFYETPRIDQLALSGMRFTNAYASACVCSPTRAAIMTGKNPVDVSITTYINPAGSNQPESWNRNTRLLPAAYSDRLALAETTIAEALREANYRTFFAGKWHLGGEGNLPQDQGFEYNKGGLERGGPYGGDKYFSPYGNDQLDDGPKGEHLPDRLASETVSFMERHRDEPFLAYLSFYSVHTPLMARADLEKKFGEKASKGADPGKRFAFKDSRPLRTVQDHAVYAGMVAAMDEAVGKVLDGIESLDLAENTVVIFTADNGGLSTSEGWPTSNLPLRAGKGWNYEGGIREPLIVRYPGLVQPGTISDAPVISSDLFATMLEIAQAPAPAEGIEGKSILPALREEDLPERSLYWHFPHYGNQGGSPSGVIRTGNWKLIHFFETDSYELYDLRDDPGETSDLAAAFPGRMHSMAAELTGWQQDKGVRFPTINSDYNEAKAAESFRDWVAKAAALERENFISMQ